MSSSVYGNNGMCAFQLIKRLHKGQVTGSGSLLSHLSVLSFLKFHFASYLTAEVCSDFTVSGHTF